MDNYIGLSTNDIIEHFGVKGMKWGVRKLYDNHKQNLLYQYKRKGYTDEQAQEKLKKRLRNEKIVLGTAAAAAAGVAAYYGKNYVQDEFLGRSFKTGKKFDTVTSATKFDNDRHIYAAYRKHDKMKYRGIYGGQRARQRKNLIKTTSKKLTDDIISDSENKLDAIARRSMYAKQIGKGVASGAAVGLISSEAATTAARKLDERKKRKEAHK